jgi:hypothetical protein
VHVSTRDECARGCCGRSRIVRPRPHGYNANSGLRRRSVSVGIRHQFVCAILIAIVIGGSRERTSTPPETPQRPANPPQRAPQQTGASPLVTNAYESTYTPFPSRTTVARRSRTGGTEGPGCRQAID